MPILNVRSVFVGILATITMDVLSVAALKLGLIAFLPPRLTGRWFASMAREQFLHTDIAQVPSINHEMAIAIPMHYAVGITLALFFGAQLEGHRSGRHLAKCTDPRRTQVSRN